MTQPDRLTRTVEKLMAHEDEACLHANIVMLLRAEGRYQRAQVRKHIRALRQAEVDGLNIRQYLIACDDLLVAVTQLGRTR